MPQLVNIERVAHGGHGICRVNGAICFAPGAIPGDQLEILDVQSKKGVLWAKEYRIAEPSEHRVAPSCPNAGVCPACSWAHFAYPAQAEWKRALVADALRRQGGIDTEVQWLEDPDLRLGYRTRAEFHGDGLALGFFKPGTHTLLDTEYCPALHERLNEALGELRRFWPEGALTVTVNPEDDDVLVWGKQRDERLAKHFPGYNAAKGKGERAYFVCDGVPIVNGGFSQASLLLNRMLVEKVHALLDGCESVLDLYCGNGNLTLGLPDTVHVLGLDHHRASVEAARLMEKHDYKLGFEADFPKALEQQAWEAVLLDPPRQGAKAVMPALAECAAKRIVYVSCDPATLARDLKTLCKAGWAVEDVTAIDLFPNTRHVETVALVTQSGMNVRAV